MPDPIDLDAVQSRIDAATIGPWWPHSGEVWAHEKPTDIKDPRWVATTTDGDFIASARTDLPHAVQILREIREAALVAVGDAAFGSPSAMLRSAGQLNEAVLRLTGGES